MRRLLVDYARARQRLKRGGDQWRISLTAAAAIAHEIEETAQVMGVSTHTVERGWRAARAWLQTELRERMGLFHPEIDRLAGEEGGPQGRHSTVMEDLLFCCVALKSNTQRLMQFGS